ncbi:hypothetical protein NSA19_07595 [Actinomyces bowdenii]|uniref:DUF6571 family protein n=1 Tax=Actinomyces bowdenii TaxID=131109 RepID=UPI00214C1400|nr:DUF6571 family protein [Actinomyces bowdenii]MCR2052712.1 hypothetical protein [Actinomyces bowdenii]
MSYIYLDPEGMQTLIDNLNSYAKSTGSSREGVIQVKDFNSHNGVAPVDLGTFSSTLGECQASLESKARGLKYRLEAAKAANETGMTTTAPDGTIAYYLPDGVADNADNLIVHNDVEAWRQAKEDTATLTKYSEEGCSAEEWDALLERMRENQEDPAYANTVTSTIGPAKVLDCINDIQRQFPSSNLPNNYVPSSRPTAGEDLGEVMGHILATASTTWSDAKAEDYANRLADATQESGKGARIYALNSMLSASRELDVDEDGVADTIGLDYSDPLLVTLGRRLEDYPYEPVRGSDLGAIGVDQGRPNAPVDLNPLAGVVHAMTGNPEAGQDWLVPTPAGPATPDAISTEGSVVHTDRIQKIIEKGALTDEQWTTDWARLGDRIDRGEGTPSLTLVRSDEAQGDFDRSAAATAVSGILNGLGSGREAPVMTDEGRELVSHVLARHPEAVDVSAEYGNPDGAIQKVRDAASSERLCDPLLTDRALTHLVGQISQNPEASAHLGEAITGYHEEQLQEAVASYEATGDVEPVNAVLTTQSTTNGFFAGADAHQLMVHADRKDKIGGTSNELTSFAAGLIPVAGSGASLAVSQGKPFAVDNSEQAAAEVENIESRAVVDNSEQITLALLNSGVYDQADLQDSVSNSGGEPGKANKNALRLVDLDGNLLVSGMTPEELSSGDVQAGLHALGGSLTSPSRPGLDFRAAIAKRFEEGYDVGNPNGVAPPAHDWNTEEEDQRDN